MPKGAPSNDPDAVARRLSQRFKSGGPVTELSDSLLRSVAYSEELNLPSDIVVAAVDELERRAAERQRELQDRGEAADWE